MKNPAQLDLFLEGVELFNQGEFFACHETLEQVWLNSQGERKLFLQGLIQIAVGFYHLRRDNTVGAERLLSAGAAKLKSHGDGQKLVDGAALLAAIEPVIGEIQAGRARNDAPHPRIQVMPNATLESLR